MKLFLPLTVSLPETGASIVLKSEMNQFESGMAQLKFFILIDLKIFYLFYQKCPESISIYLIFVPAHQAVALPFCDILRGIV